MRAVLISQQGSPVSPNVRYVTDAPEPVGPEGIPAGHVVIETLCSALNHLDLWVGRGVPGLDLTYPRISGCDACGTVIASGLGVDRAWLGARVIVNAAREVVRVPRPGDPTGDSLAPDYALIGEHTDGMHRERFIAPAANLARVGDDQDPAAAAAFGLTFLTAWSMLVTKGGLRPGHAVLITGIGGGVSTAALAIARHHACVTIVTSRHEWKLERALALGATHAILDTGQAGGAGGGGDWSREVRARTGGRGVDIAVDSSGKATHLKCIKALARGGAYVTPGCTSGPDAVTDLARVFWNQLRILGSTMGSNNEFAMVAALFRAGSLAPAVDKVFPAERAMEAFSRLESGEQMGKVVIDWRGR